MLQLDTSSRYVSVLASRYTTSLYPFSLASSWVRRTCRGVPSMVRHNRSTFHNQGTLSSETLLLLYHKSRRKHRLQAICIWMVPWYWWMASMTATIMLVCTVWKGKCIPASSCLLPWFRPCHQGQPCETESQPASQWEWAGRPWSTLQLPLQRCRRCTMGQAPSLELDRSPWEAGGCRVSLSLRVAPGEPVWFRTVHGVSAVQLLCSETGQGGTAVTTR